MSKIDYRKVAKDFIESIQKFDNLEEKIRGVSKGAISIFEVTDPLYEAMNTLGDALFGKDAYEDIQWFLYERCGDNTVTWRSDTSEEKAYKCDTLEQFLDMMDEEYFNKEDYENEKNDRPKQPSTNGVTSFNGFCEVVFNMPRDEDVSE